MAKSSTTICYNLIQMTDKIIDWLPFIFFWLTFSVFIVGGIKALLPQWKKLKGKKRLFDRRMCFIKNPGSNSGGYCHLIATEDELIITGTIIVALIMSKTNMLLALSPEKIESFNVETNQTILLNLKHDVLSISTSKTPQLIKILEDWGVKKK